MTRAPGTLVIALGGNAILRAGDDGSIALQLERAAEAAEAIAGLACEGERIVLTHGNGPVVGNIVLRGELARASVPPTPLYIADADSEGGIGLVLQQALGNALRRRGSNRCPVTVVTQVEVEPDDPAFTLPTKPIGPRYPRDQRDLLARERGWAMAEQPDGTVRRVVASPHPVRIVEAEAVAALLEAGAIPIAAGGGGVPVVRGGDGMLEGVDAVIDKDWTSAVLACALGASTLAILMEADAVYEGWGTPGAQAVRTLDGVAARELSRTLDPGGIGPKLAAAAWFASQGGTTVMCAPVDLPLALDGQAGTTVVD